MKRLKTGVFKIVLCDCFYKLSGFLILDLRQMFMVDFTFLKDLYFKIKNRKCNCFLESNSKVKSKYQSLKVTKFFKNIHLINPIM